MTNEFHLYTQPGIGDVLFTLTKLYTYIDKPLHLHTMSRQVYSAPFLYGLENVEKVEQFEYSKNNNYNSFKEYCASQYNKYAVLEGTELNNLDNMYLDENWFLEEGNRIEQYLPKLQTTFKFPWKFNKTHYNNAVQIARNSIVFYTSSAKNHSNRKLVDNWTKEQWANLMNQIQESYPSKNLIWIGSSYDLDMLDYLKSALPFEFKYCVDHPAEFIIPLLRECDAFISYQSGLSVISVYEEVRTFMCYFNIYKTLFYSFCPLTSIQNDVVYKPVTFEYLCQNPNSIFDWLSNCKI